VSAQHLRGSSQPIIALSGSCSVQDAPRLVVAITWSLDHEEWEPKRYSSAFPSSFHLCGSLLGTLATVSRVPSQVSSGTANPVCFSAW
jgi:hypothetical protein